MRKRMMTGFLIFCMLVMLFSVSVFAADGVGTSSLEDPASAAEGLCEHHSEHTDDCGYREAIAARECTHEHDASCGYAEAVEEVPCDQSCEDTDGDGTIDHSEDCGYRPAVEAQACTHVHDEECGYQEGQEGSPCIYVCRLCDESAPENEYSVGTREELEEAVAAINGAESGSFIISLTDNIVLAGSAQKKVFYIERNEVTLLGNGHTITYGNAEASAQSGLTLGSNGGVLNLGRENGTSAENALTITADPTYDHADPLLKVLGGGTVNLYDGVVLTGNCNTSSDGGAVEIQNGTFNMYGGIISDCTAMFGLGGGVRAYGSGGKAVFNMYGGVIEGNKALKTSYSSYADGGGVCVMGSNAEFTMYGGVIRDNQASFRGGGVCNYGAKVTIKEGTISRNTSGAGENKNRGYGGGICNFYGSMTIEGGTIEDNQALNGGGICAYCINYESDEGEMVISNCTIQNNQAEEGGGVFSVLSKDVQIDHAVISGNQSKDWGGGIYAYGSQISLQNSKIDGNKAITGGGLLMEGSQVSVKDTTIEKNEVSGDNAMAGGIYFDNDGLSLSGKVVVQRNQLVQGEKKLENNVYFMYAKVDQGDQAEEKLVYQTVNIEGALTDSQIGVTEQGVMEGMDPSPAFTSGYDENNQGVAPKTYFTSDDPNWIVLYSKDGTKEARLGKAVTVTYQWAETSSKPSDAVLPPPDVIEKGTAYTAKEKPTANGYVFSGWFTDEACTARYEDGSVLQEDLTLYGTWSPVPSTGPTYPVGPTDPDTPPVPTDPDTPPAPVDPDDPDDIVTPDDPEKPSDTDDPAHENTPEKPSKIDSHTGEKSDGQGEDGQSDVPKTGDSQDMVFWLLLMAASMTTLGAAIAMRKEQR